MTNYGICKIVLNQNNRNNRNSVITAHPVKSKTNKPTEHNYEGETVLSYTLKPRSGEPPLGFTITDVVDSTEFKIVNKPSEGNDE